MTLHIYTPHPQPMSLPSINILHLMVSEIQPRQGFPTACRSPIWMPWVKTIPAESFKGCGVKNKSGLVIHTTFEEEQATVTPHLV